MGTTLYGTPVLRGSTRTSHCLHYLNLLQGSTHGSQNFLTYVDVVVVVVLKGWLRRALKIMFEAEE